MSNDEIVRNLMEHYKAGTTGVVWNWFVVKLDDEVRAEFDRRFHEGWWGIKFEGFWVFNSQPNLSMAPMVTWEAEGAMRFQEADLAKKYATETLGLAEGKFDIEQFIDC